MAKSRSTRSNRKSSERVRMALLYIFCCGRRKIIKDFGADSMTIGEEIRQAQNIIYKPSHAVPGRNLDQAAHASKDSTILQKVPKGPAPKRPSVHPRPLVPTKCPTDPQSDDYNIEKEQVKKMSSKGNKLGLSTTETKSFETYPDDLNPFAEKNDGRNIDDDGGNNNDDGRNIDDDKNNDTDGNGAMKDYKDKVKQEMFTRTIEDYPEELNPFADDEDIPQDNNIDTNDGK